MCRLDPRAIELPATPRQELFPSPAVAFSNRPSPDSRESGSFSRVASPLRSFFASPSVHSFQSGPSCQGFIPLRGITEGVHLRVSSRAPATFRPQVFSTSRRLAPPYSFAGLLHPATTSRVHPFRGFSRSAACLARRQSLPPCRYHPDAHRQAGCHVRMARLRGLAPRIEAFPRVGV